MTFGINGPPDWVSGEVYIPLPQALSPPQALSIVARLGGEAADFQKRLPELVREACAACAVSNVRPFKTVLTEAVEAPRSLASLVAAFAFLALVLAAAGIYGVVSHGVVRRTRELGIRMALGAGRGRVAWLVIASSLRATLAGSALGLTASWALARWMRTLLYGIAEHDLLSYSLAPMLLAAAAILASLVPVSRALRIDPAQSLRDG
jgi:ABC-type antimicrobial peptide transport system permease subunit